MCSAQVWQRYCGTVAKAGGKLEKTYVVLQPWYRSRLKARTAPSRMVCANESEIWYLYLTGTLHRKVKCLWRSFCPKLRQNRYTFWRMSKSESTRRRRQAVSNERSLHSMYACLKSLGLSELSSWSALISRTAGCGPACPDFDELSRFVVWEGAPYPANWRVLWNHIPGKLYGLL